VTLTPRLNDSPRHFAVNTCCILASVADTFSHLYVSKCTAWWSNYRAQATQIGDTHAQRIRFRDRRGDGQGK